MTPEGRVKDKVKKVIAKHGKYVFSRWPVSNGMGQPTLDCYGCVCGFAFFIETKAEGEELTPRQALTASEMNDANGTVFVIAGVDSPGIPFLDEWLAHRVAMAKEVEGMRNITVNITGTPDVH